MMSFLTHSRVSTDNNRVDALIGKMALVVEGIMSRSFISSNFLLFETIRVQVNRNQ